MGIPEALGIVLDLATQNALTERDADGDAGLLEEIARQSAALEIITELTRGYAAGEI